jgi:predicted urease superfamily metal-dependent hydrolase
MNKDFMLRVRMNKEHVRKLDACVKLANTDRSKIVLHLIEMAYTDAERCGCFKGVKNGEGNSDPAGRGSDQSADALP